MIAYAHRAEPLDEHPTIDGIAIANQMSWRFMPWKRLRQLLCHPLRRGMRRDVDPNEVAAGDPDDDETVQQPEADCGHNKEIDGSNVGSVIAQKRAPSLGRRPSPLDHVSSDRRLRYSKPSFSNSP